jgi:hypothetical protein
MDLRDGVEGSNLFAALKMRARGLYSCKFLRMGVGWVHVGTEKMGTQANISAWGSVK